MARQAMSAIKRDASGKVRAAAFARHAVTRRVRRQTCAARPSCSHRRTMMPQRRHHNASVARSPFFFSDARH